MAPQSPRKIPQVLAAYNQLKSMILDNDIAANSQILEQELAERLGMSRTPVREAINKLESDGLVEVVPRRGVRILPLSGKDMAEIYMLLTGLESTAAEYVAKKGVTDHELGLLQTSVNMMRLALSNNDLQGWAQADEKFHKLLVELTRNTRLISMVETLWDQAHRARMVTLKLRPKPNQSIIDHQALVDAIANKDSATAFEVHHTHLENSRDVLVKLLEDLGLTQL